MGDVTGYNGYDQIGFDGYFSVNGSVILVFQAHQLDTLQSQGLMGLTNDVSTVTMIDQAFKEGYISVYNLFGIVE